MRLRPHHLLCTQAYSGKGYSDAFVEKMNTVTEKLRREASTEIEVVFGTDDLCESCPHKLGDDLCDTNEKVKRFDAGVIKHFQIEEKKYIYQDITKKIRENMTKEMLEEICSGCEWYSISACRRILIGKKKKCKKKSSRNRYLREDFLCI